MRVSVTQAHINQGWAKRSHSWECPAALALGPGWYVWPDWGYASQGWFRNPHRLSDDARRKIIALTESRKISQVEPFEFDMEPVPSIP